MVSNFFSLINLKHIRHHQWFLCSSTASITLFTYGHTYASQHIVAWGCNFSQFIFFYLASFRPSHILYWSVSTWGLLLSVSLRSILISSIVLVLPLNYRVHIERTWAATVNRKPRKMFLGSMSLEGHRQHWIYYMQSRLQIWIQCPNVSATYFDADFRQRLLVVRLPFHWFGQKSKLNSWVLVGL